MMKTRSFLLSTLAVFIFAGCSSEDAREGNIPGGAPDGKAYLSLSLQSHTATSSSFFAGSITFRTKSFVFAYLSCTLNISLSCSSG